MVLCFSFYCFLMQSTLALSFVSLSLLMMNLPTDHHILLTKTIRSLREFLAAGVKIVTYLYSAYLIIL